MSIESDIETAVKAQFANPDFRASLEGVERSVGLALVGACKSLLPGFVRTLAGGLVDKLGQEAVDKLVAMTDHELLSIAGGSMKLTEVPNAPAP